MRPNDPPQTQANLGRESDRRIRRGEGGETSVKATTYNPLPPVMASNHTAGPPTLYGLEPHRQPSRWPEFKGDQDAEGPYEC